MHEQARSAQIGQMLDTQLFRFARWVQRVRKQKESRNKLWFGGAEYCRLASAVGVAAEKDPARDRLTQCSNRVAQARAIALRIARKRGTGSPFALLAKGQIAAQNQEALCGKGFAERDQQRSRAIRACAVCEDQRVAVCRCG